MDGNAGRVFRRFLVLAASSWGSFQLLLYSITRLIAAIFSLFSVPCARVYLERPRWASSVLYMHITSSILHEIKISFLYKFKIPSLLKKLKTSSFLCKASTFFTCHHAFLERSCRDFVRHFSFDHCCARRNYSSPSRLRHTPGDLQVARSTIHSLDSAASTS